MLGAIRPSLPGRRNRGCDPPDRAGTNGRGGHPLPPRAADQVITDALTGLGNRRKLFADLASWWQRPEAVTSPSLLMMFDLDGFKAYNDTFGHSAGDALLARLGAKLAATIARTARPTGSAATSSASCSTSTSIIWTT